MGRRNIIREYQVFSSADTSTSPDSAYTDVSGVDFITYRIAVGATVNAIASIKFMNGDTFSAADAEALNFGQTLSLVGATDQDYMITIENKGFKWLYIDIANNGGTGNVSAWITGTSRGA